MKTEPPETTRNAPSRALAVLPFVSESSEPPITFSRLPPATLKIEPLCAVSLEAFADTSGLAVVATI